MSQKGELAASTIISEALAGFRAIGQHPSLRVMLGIIAAETAAAGALQVYIVVLSVEVLDFGTSGVGFQNSAIGIGAFIGAAVVLSLSGARRLSPAFISGTVLWGVPLVLLGCGRARSLRSHFLGSLGWRIAWVASRVSRSFSVQFRMTFLHVSSASFRCCGSRPWRSAERSLRR